MKGEGNVLPFFAMVILQVGYAGFSIVSTLAMDSGMNPFVHVAYRQLFATVLITPFAYFFERNTRPRMTRAILFYIFLCSIFGGTLYQILFLFGLHHSTPTIASALFNLVPILTFVLAVPFGLETVGIKRRAGQAKVLGTLVCVGGALLLSLYHGNALTGGQSRIRWKYVENIIGKGNSSSHSTSVLGPFLIIVSAISWAVYLIIQAKMGQNYSAPLTSSTLLCLMSSIESGIVGFIAERDISAWLLRPNIRVISSLYAAIVCNALGYFLTAWVIEKKGPLYVCVFIPLPVVIAAFFSCMLLQEKLYVGTVIGSVLIVTGLYAVVWGNHKKTVAMKTAGTDREKEPKATGDIEMQER